VPAAERIAGRYVLSEPLASGGMGAVYLGRLLGPAGFARTVAIKKPHKHLAEDPQLLAMFLDEARLVARIRHVNVVATLEVVAEGDDYCIVMEYVPGASLLALLRARQAGGRPMPVAATVAIVCGMLRGLHAAHEARSETGEPLGIVHRDVSPGNVIVGSDGIARVLDFGVAKATNRLVVTPGTELKGKLAYMAPEYLTRRTVTFASDLFSAGVVLWECLALERLFAAGDSVATMHRILQLAVPPPSYAVGASGRNRDELPLIERLDGIVMRALQREPRERYGSALQMAAAIEQAVMPAPVDDVAKLLEASVPDVLAQRAALVARVEASTPSTDRARGNAGPPVDDLSATHTMPTPSDVSTAARRLSATRLVVAVAAAVIGVGSGVTTFLLARAPRSSVVPAATSVPAATAAPPEHPPPIAEPSAPVSVAVPEASAPPISSKPVAPSRRSPRGSAAAPQSGAAFPPAPALPPAADCEPPWVWENGVKKFRPECFAGKVR
jgi:serine/threonine-protein kinase